jgi:hypothetical protein
MVRDYVDRDYFSSIIHSNVGCISRFIYSGLRSPFLFLVEYLKNFLHIHISEQSLKMKFKRSSRRTRFGRVSSCFKVMRMIQRNMSFQAMMIVRDAAETRLYDKNSPFSSVSFETDDKEFFFAIANDQLRYFRNGGKW